MERGLKENYLILMVASLLHWLIMVARWLSCRTRILVITKGTKRIGKKNERELNKRKIYFSPNLSRNNCSLLLFRS